jgi:hypothetical protein
MGLIMRCSPSYQGLSKSVQNGGIVRKWRAEYRRAVSGASASVYALIEVFYI